MPLTNTDYFADAAEIESLLNIGTGATAVTFAEADVDAVLPIIEGEVHDYLISEGFIGAGPLLTTTHGFYTVKSVLTALLMMWNQRRQFNKNHHQTDNAEFYMNNFPHLNDPMKLQLMTIFTKNDEVGIDLIAMTKSHLDVS